MYHIRKTQEKDRVWIRDLLQKEWGSSLVVSKGVLYHADSLPGFLAEINGNRQGLLTYHISGNEYEIVTLNSHAERQGIGSALIDAVRCEASNVGVQSPLAYYKQMTMLVQSGLSKKDLP